MVDAGWKFVLGRLEVLEEGIGLALFADGGGGAVTGEHAGCFGEGEEAVVDGAEDLLGVAAGEVGAADGVGEEGVSGEEEVVLGEVEAEAAGGVAGGVEDDCGEARLPGLRRGGLGEVRVAADADEAVVGGAQVGWGDVGGGDAEPAGLEVHDADHGEVELVVEDGSAGEGFETGCAGDVVDVGVGDHDLLDGEAMFPEQGEDTGDVVAGVDDDGFAGAFVTEDGAVAPERAYGKDFVDHRCVFGDASSKYRVSAISVVYQVSGISYELSAISCRLSAVAIS